MNLRNGNISTSGTRLTAAADRKVLSTALYCLWGYTPDFLLGLSPLSLTQTNGKPQGSGAIGPMTGNIQWLYDHVLLITLSGDPNWGP